ncbi:MAG TPA: pseudouridine-5'-phosphate glycosidase [Anaerolineaceae bacterium]|nr:pseudouridine-5'-phosphate glycosidase [Anaerolineaceae bacterium]
MPLEKLPHPYVLSQEIAQARRLDLPIVALESAVITHGLPRPENLNLARQMESEVRSQEAIPATIALFGGSVHVGLSQIELENLAAAPSPRKVSRRDFATALEKNEFGGTTVAGTLIAAHTAGIRVFATGGIGGVHRNAPFDVSADLPELSRTPMVVVCAGAKAILDLPATLEYLETSGIPVIGYQTDDFPAFYSRSSGLPISACVDSVLEIARIAHIHWEMSLTSALLVVQPPPAEFALPRADVERAIQTALIEAEKSKIRGYAITPYLLNRVNELSGGASMRVNLALLRNNARLAAQIAVAISPRAKDTLHL